MKNNQAILKLLDSYIFIKRGYSLWRHLVPFCIASLMLLILSMPSDNLLLKLAQLLHTPNWIWLSAGMLTIVAIFVYILLVRSQIKRSYLWNDNGMIRIINTSVIYLVSCTLMALIVFSSTVPQSKLPILSRLWACLIIAALSLTGIGWEGPSNWVEDLGLTMPDYTLAQEDVIKLSKILKRLRGQSRAASNDRDLLLSVLNDLKSEIEKNISLEPTWAKASLEETVKILNNFIEQLERYFMGNNIEDLALALQFKKQAKYEDFVEAAKILSNHCTEWNYHEN